MATNGDLVNQRISNFRDELSVRYPKLKNTDELNCALDLSRLVISTFTRDSQARLDQLEAELCRVKTIFKYALSFLSAIVVALLSNFFMKLI
tara:strand:+ start:23 stop:298 length:276 start_codon:yes stop_codon:yes gene_type:complete